MLYLSRDNYEDVFYKLKKCLPKASFKMTYFNHQMTVRHYFRKHTERPMTLRWETSDMPPYNVCWLDDKQSIYRIIKSVQPKLDVGKYLTDQFKGIDLHYDDTDRNVIGGKTINIIISYFCKIKHGKYLHLPKVGNRGPASEQTYAKKHFKYLPLALNSKKKPWILIRHYFPIKALAKDIQAEYTAISNVIIDKHKTDTEKILHHPVKSRYAQFM